MMTGKFIATIVLLALAFLFASPFVSLVSSHPHSGSFHTRRQLHDWNFSSLHSQVSEDASLEDLEKFKAINIGNWGCLDNFRLVKHSINHFRAVGQGSLTNYMRGTTLWINEYQAVGHALFDLYTAQVLKSANVSRIILQRAPCATQDLCQHIGTWKSFYEGFYAILMDAMLGSGNAIPIFVRFHDTNVLEPYYLRINASTRSVERIVNEGTQEGPLMLNSACFERVVMRGSDEWLANIASPSVAEAIKTSARKIIFNTSSSNPFFPVVVDIPGVSTDTNTSIHGTDMVPSLVELSAKRPFVITHAFRGPTMNRGIHNVQLIKDLLGNEFSGSSYFFRSVETFNRSVNYIPQISLVADTDVLITEQGAFQSNVIFMKRGSLLVDLRGNYEEGHCTKVANVAKNFGIYSSFVVTTGLTDTSEAYNITVGEVHSVINIIREFYNFTTKFEPKKESI